MVLGLCEQGVSGGDKVKRCAGAGLGHVIVRCLYFSLGAMGSQWGILSKEVIHILERSIPKHNSNRQQPFDRKYLKTQLVLLPQQLPFSRELLLLLLELQLHSGTALQPSLLFVLSFFFART